MIQGHLEREVRGGVVVRARLLCAVPVLARRRVPVLLYPARAVVVLAPLPLVPAAPPPSAPEFVLFRRTERPWQPGACCARSKQNADLPMISTKRTRRHACMHAGPVDPFERPRPTIQAQP